MSEMMEQVKLSGLLDSERADAFDEARRKLVGAEPVFTLDTTGGAYPPRLRQAILGFIVALLVAAFIPSAMRIFQIAYEEFPLPAEFIKAIAGFSLVMLAEVGQIGFTLAATVAAEDNKRVRGAFNAGALTCTFIALFGNGTYLRSDTQSAALIGFTMLETFAPPVLTLIAAYALKTLALHSIKARFEARRTYEAAQVDWRQRYEQAHTLAAWPSVIGNTLYDALKRKNKALKAVLRTITPETWYTLIQRELDAENWYTNIAAAHQAQVAAEAAALPVEAAADGEKVKHTPGVRTGETGGHIHATDGGYTWECQYCGRSDTRPTARGAANALAQHYRHCEARAHDSVQSNGHIKVEKMP